MTVICRVLSCQSFNRYFYGRKAYSVPPFVTTIQQIKFITRAMSHRNVNLRRGNAYFFFFTVAASTVLPVSPSTATTIRRSKLELVLIRMTLQVDPAGGASTLANR